MRRAAAGLALSIALAAPAAAHAAPAWVGVGDFDMPTHVAGPPGDAARLFVVEKAGVVRLVVDGAEAATPFADLRAQVDDSGERGLLSIAFPADHAASGLFYLFATAAEGGFPGAAAGDLIVAEGRRSAQNANRADGTYRVVARIPHPATNHNGGQLAFGPDGALYASIGDGGSQGDPEGDAQDPASLLGKVLRLADPRTGAAPEIWALGLRNPWRFSFDRTTGDVLIGDVGGALREEVNRVPFAGAAGRNYGWNRCEGDVGDCGWPGSTAPLLALPRAGGFSGVIGGFVVRDPGVPSLLGRYLFADLGQANAWTADIATGAYREEPGLPAGGPLSFGEDGCGRVHLATGGAVQRLSEAGPAGCVPPLTAAPPGGGPPPRAPAATADTTAPTLRVLRGKRRVRAFVLRLRAGEPARAAVSARGYRTRRVTLAAGVTERVRVQARRRTIRRLRGQRRVVRTVRIRVADAAGNVTRRAPRIRLR